MLSREERHHPNLGLLELSYLKTLEAHGIKPGSYNLPQWENSAAGFKKCLEELFQFTPPTALIIEESQFFMAALLELSRRGIWVPKDVSLFCTDDDPVFEMCDPYVSCIHWPTDPVVTHIFKWVQRVSRGNVTRKAVNTPARIIEGGTIGPASR
jgi:DNA-binding LacI/PurR family transcriptional regulator